MLEMRFHARPGQGLEAAVELLTLAARAEGKYAQGFTKRSSSSKESSVRGFARVDEQPITVNTEIEEPDLIVVLDEGLLAHREVTKGLKPTGIVILNTSIAPSQIRGAYGCQATLGVVAADQIAQEILGTPLVNFPMLGAVIKVTQAVRLESLEPLLMERLGSGGKKIFAALQMAYMETVIQERET